ncbi:MAG TPA: hypothetical protein PLP05_05850 [Sedimentisphaerales bacterium]|nr:hypothetical protein [Sedimentisphaerales bacterium]
MNKNRKYKILICSIAVCLALIGFIGADNLSPAPEDYTAIDAYPSIKPDYTDITIPPNIAPMNFSIQHQAEQYYVKIYSDNAPAITLTSKSPDVIIPLKSWHELLDANKTKKLCIDVYTKAKNNSWQKFKTITNTIAPEPIDSYLVYRNIPPVHGQWYNMSINQRNLTSFKTSLILNNDYFQRGCINCHTFCSSNPDKMMLSIRSDKYQSSTILVEGDSVKKLGAKFTYSTWHPTGKIIVFSYNKIKQFFNSAEDEVRNVVDLDSMLAYYDLDKKVIKTIPAFTGKDILETYPAFSPDGKYLYYCTAKKLWADNDEKFPPDNYNKVRYDIVRISCDVEKDSWGSPEIIVSSEKTQKSSLEPRISPDGRWLVFCMCDYGCFPVYRSDSDLYLIDLENAQKTGDFSPRKLSANSNQSESWHSFSTNSRWLAFSSKALRPRLTVTQFSYIDQQGNSTKPFILPQKSPDFYDSFAMTFSVPEFVTGPVIRTHEQLARVIRSSTKITVDMPITMATPEKGTDSAWQERE